MSCYTVNTTGINHLKIKFSCRQGTRLGQSKI